MHYFLTIIPVDDFEFSTEQLLPVSISDAVLSNYGTEASNLGNISKV